MGALGLLKRLFIDLFVVTAIFVFIPGIPPNTSYKSYKTDEVRKFEGPLSQNTRLDSVERLFEDRIVGPESIASRSPDEIFVSAHGGKIARIWGERWDHMKVVASIGPGCAGPWEEHICGRPLGLRFAADGRLLVADSYLGVFAVDVETGEKELLVDPKEEIAGKLPRIVDDLDIDDDGNIYWSDASSISNLADGVLEFLSDGTGRLVKYDPKTKSNTVLIKDVHFANGVQLSPDKDFVLVSETVKNRVLRFWLKGPKSGKVDVFVDKLPGSPDNIRPRSEGGYYITLIVSKIPEKFDFTSLLTRVPYFRKFVSRFLYVIQLGIDGISKLIPNNITPQVSYSILHLEPLAHIMGPSIVLEVDEAGAIVGSLQGKVRFFSETSRVGDHLFFGSPYNKFLGHLFIGEPTLEVEGERVRVVPASQEVEREKPVVDAGEQASEQVTEEVSTEFVESHSAEVEEVVTPEVIVGEEEIEETREVENADEEKEAIEEHGEEVHEQATLADEEQVVFAEEQPIVADKKQSSLGIEERDDLITEEKQQAVVEDSKAAVEDQVKTAKEEQAMADEEEKPEVAEEKIEAVTVVEESKAAEEEQVMAAEGEHVAAAEDDQTEVAEEKSEEIKADVEDHVEIPEEEKVEAAEEDQSELAEEKFESVIVDEAAVEKQVEAAVEEQVEAAVEAASEHISATVEEPVEDVQKMGDNFPEEEGDNAGGFVGRHEVKMTESKDKVVPEVETHRKEEL